MLSLQTNARFELARGLRNQGLCYPSQSADRINALSQAVELLSAVAEQELEPPLSWQVREEEIACRRLLGDFATAERQLSAWERIEPSGPALSRCAERIRLALARQSIWTMLFPKPGAWRGRSSGRVRVRAGPGWKRFWPPGNRRSSGATRGAPPNGREGRRPGGRRRAAPEIRFHRGKPSRCWCSMTAGRLAPRSIETLARAGRASIAAASSTKPWTPTTRPPAAPDENPTDSTAADSTMPSSRHDQQHREQYRDAIDRYRKLAADRPARPRPRSPLAGGPLRLATGRKTAATQTRTSTNGCLANTSPPGPRATASQAWWWLGAAGATAFLARGGKGLSQRAARRSSIRRRGRSRGAMLSGTIGPVATAKVARTPSRGQAVEYFEQRIGPGGHPPQGWDATARGHARGGQDQPAGGPQRRQPLRSHAQRGIAQLGGLRRRSGPRNWISYWWRPLPRKAAWTRPRTCGENIPGHA